MTAASTPERIVVLGGGIAAMTAVFELTEQPNWQDKYDITVYQMGWRLGGKGASGRGEDGRIIEHGLHLWFGFYENAFNVMGRAYQAFQDMGLYPDSPIRSIDKAFAPQEFFEYDEHIDGAWMPWDMPFKVTPNEYPGDGDHMRTIIQAILKVIEKMQEAVSNYLGGTSVDNVTAEEAVASPDSGLAALISHGEYLLQRAHEIAMQLHLADQADNVPHLARTDETTEAHGFLQGLLESFFHWFESEIEKLPITTELRRLILLIQMGYYNIKGVLEDDVLFSPEGFDSINDEEYTAWLARHGAPQDLLTSALLSGVYDMAFTYRDGIPAFENRSVAAGTAVYGMLRMFLTYQGAVFFKMNAGMGDIVFAPLYAVLSQRGVKFNFFSRVTNIGVSGDKTSVQTIDMALQATPKDTYDPLIFVKNLPAWPNDPLYDQLKEGAQMQAMQKEGINVDLESFYCAWPDVGQLTLTAGQDFDKVILGISIGAFPYVCPELIANSSAWQDMIANVPTVWTRQYELWMTKTAAELGTTSDNPLAMSYAEPGDVWTNMSHLLPVEDWQGSSVPQSIYYVGSVMPTPTTQPPPDQHDFPTEAKQMALKPMETYLQNSAALIWPKGTQADNPNALDWSVLYAKGDAKDEARLLQQDIRANINPTERQPIAKEKSWRFKLKPSDSKYGRLYLAGDWTYVGVLSFGCVEGAVLSGRLCSQAICGYPTSVFS